MGFFADLPKNIFTQTTDFVWTSVKIAYQSVYNAPILLATEKLDIYYDECNFTYASDFGVLHLRNPYCQPPTPPPIPPPSKEPVKVPRNLLSCGNLPVFALKLIASQESSILNSQDAPEHRKGAHYISKQDVEILSIKYPVEFKIPENQPQAGKIIYGAQVLLRIQRTFSGDRIDSLSNSYNAGFKKKVFYDETRNYDVWFYSQDRKDMNHNGELIYIEQRGKSYPIYEFGFTPEDNIGYFDFAGAAIFGSTEAIDAWERTVPTVSKNEITVNQWQTIIRKRTYQIITMCGDIETPPPPPPKEPEDKDMDCCDELRALLKLTLKRIGNLPANVPDNFAKQNPSMIRKESLAELMLWQMEQLDALSGAYPIEIEIEDSDLVQAGSQKQKVSLPNQAEALAELIGMVLTIKRDTHASLITSIKAMGEAGMGKNLSVKILDVALANAEFLGYKLDQIEKEVPSLFTPNGKDITETLQEKNVKIISYDNNDKNDLQDDLKVLKTMAARWNAQNWRALTGDVVQSLKQNLFDKPDAISEAGKEDKQPDFNDFTEEAERGFTATSGITDSVNPWGRPFKERPKIREIGTDKGRYKDE